MVNLGLLGKHCVPGVDILQHVFTIEVYCPDNIGNVNEGEVRGVVKGCVDLAVAEAVVTCGGNWVLCTTAFLSGRLGQIIQTGVDKHLKAAGEIGRLMGKKVRIKTSEETHWN